MLCLPHDCHKILRDAVERAYPEEACGILLGRRGEVVDQAVRVIVCDNTAAEPRRRYAIAPEALIAAQRSAREAGLEILGFYHSHPDHPAGPSETDLREAHWPECVYLICGVEEGRLASIAAWKLEEPARWRGERLEMEWKEG